MTESHEPAAEQETPAVPSQPLPDTAEEPETPEVAPGVPAWEDAAAAAEQAQADRDAAADAPDPGADDA